MDTLEIKIRDAAFKIGDTIFIRLVTDVAYIGEIESLTENTVTLSKGTILQRYEGKWKVPADNYSIIIVLTNVEQLFPVEYGSYYYLVYHKNKWV